MVYDVFVKLAQKQDSRNNFQPYNKDVSFVPNPLRSFYTSNNPLDVEIRLCDSTSVRFCPIDYLRQLQKEYDAGESSFIFATQEGDPVYYTPDGIFSFTHGVSKQKETKICNSFDSYIELLSKEMINGPN